MKYLKAFNENVDESSMDFLEEYEFFVDESEPDSPLYHEYRVEIEPDDADEYSVWTPKGNIEIIVMDKETLDSFKDSRKYKRLGTIDDLKNHFMSQFEDSDENIDKSIEDILRRVADESESKGWVNFDKYVKEIKKLF